MKYLVFDIGGSSIKYAIFGCELTIVESGKIPRQNSFEEMIEQMIKVYNEQEEITGISISAPGIVDSKIGTIGGLSALDYIHGPNFKEVFKTKTNLDIAIENDANCAALSSAYFGEDKDKQNIIYVVIGSGIGGAILNNQKILYGANGYAGEFGYQIINDKMQSWSEVGSTVNLVNRVRKVMNNFFIEGEEVFKLAKTNNQVNELVEEFYDCNARALFNLQMAFDPDVILLGGGISENKEVIKEIQNRVELLKVKGNIEQEIKIKVGQFGANANLFGALVNLLQQEEQNMN